MVIHNIKDTHNEKFHAEVEISCTWHENQELENYDPDSNWNPNLFIENIFQQSNEQIMFHLTKKHNQTIITETRRIKGNTLEILT